MWVVRYHVGTSVKFWHAGKWSALRFLYVMQWARAVSPIQLLEQNDPIFKWRAQMFDKFRRVVEPTVGFQQSLKAAK